MRGGRAAADSSIAPMDHVTHVPTLPGELWTGILCGAGAICAARARAVSRSFDSYGTAALGDIARETRRIVGDDHRACVRLMLCAIARDDVEDLARVFMTGILDPRLPAIPHDVEARQLLQARLHTVVAGSGSWQRLSVMCGQLSGCRRTPLDIAADFGSLRSLRLLASLGARPTETVECLVRDVLSFAREERHIAVVTEQTGMCVIGPVPTSAVDVVHTLLGLFGRSVPLATGDTNVLTCLRRQVARHHGSRHVATRVSRECVLRDLALIADDPTDDDIVVAIAGSLLGGRVWKRPTDTYLPRALAREIVHRPGTPYDWREAMRVLLRAGYSPDERAWVFGAASVDEVNAASERQAVEREVARRTHAVAHAFGVAHETGERVELMFDLLQELVHLCVVEDIAALYAHGRPAPPSVPFWNRRSV